MGLFPNVLRITDFTFSLEKAQSPSEKYFLVISSWKQKFNEIDEVEVLFSEESLKVIYEKLKDWFEEKGE